MRIAIASGKGGTGKTTVAIALALDLAGRGIRTTYADCDVEEPNGGLFLEPTIEQMETVTAPVPEIDPARCTLCGSCAEACRFNALARLRDRVLVVAELCRGCGACVLVCPSGAVEEIGRPVGVVRRGRVGGLLFVDGELAVGEASATPVIAAVKHAIPGGGVAVLDAPPGASCPMVEAVRGADRVILVVEPTPFGLSDLGPAAGAARALGLAPAVVVNRCDVGDAGVHALCEKEGLPIVAEIPYDRAIAEAYAQGVVPSLRSSVLADAVGRIAGELLGAPRTEDAL